jgi:hypothetical protein
MMMRRRPCRLTQLPSRGEPKPRFRWALSELRHRLPLLVEFDGEPFRIIGSRTAHSRARHVCRIGLGR